MTAIINSLEKSVKAFWSLNTFYQKILIKSDLDILF